MKNTQLIFHLFIAILLVHYSCIAQTEVQATIDSLLIELPKHQEDTSKIRLLTILSYNYPYINPDAGLKYGTQALELAEKLKNSQDIAGAHASIGANYANKSDYAKALHHEYIALKIYEQLKDKVHEAGLLRNIGIVLRNSKNQTKALEYDFKALKIYEELNDKIGMAILYGNIANVYYSLKDKEKVIDYNFKALYLYKELNNREGTARVTGNIANFYAVEGDFSKAMVFYFEAVRQETALGNINGITRNMGNIGETYLDIYKNYNSNLKSDSLIPASKEANLSKALYYLKTTISKSKELQQIEYYLAFAEVLSEAYLLSGNTKNSFDLYKEYISIRDSVYNVEELNEANRKELKYEYEKREDAITFQKKLTDIKLAQEKMMRKRETLFFSIGLFLVLVFSGFMYNRWRLTQKQKKIIEKEKKRSDELLLNILPDEVAEELKQKGSADAKQFEQVTVLFTDFKGFTSMAEKLAPKELVRDIHECFSAFDLIIEKHGIEKIKTIGDAYMAAGGIPTPNTTHAVDVIQAAFEICEFIEAVKAAKIANHAPFFEIRIGVHTGSVVAGIVGVKKFAYDIWGDTVNLASRMESSGEVGKINISGSTYELVKEKFNCVHRGKIYAKNKGEVDMYYVDRSVSES